MLAAETMSPGPHQSSPISERTNPASLRQLVRYLALVLVLPALFYPLPFLLVQLPSYEQWSASQWTPMLEYSFDERPKNADVVIFGDSSAFLGIDPRILNRQLGIRSVVLPDTVGSIPVTGDQPLRSYLAHNPPPRLLILYFSAWDLDFSQIDSARTFEGQEMMFRHMTRREIWSYTAHHPAEILQFPFRLYSTFGPKIVKAALHHVHREEETAQALGHVDYTEPVEPLTAACRIPAKYMDVTGSASVQDLKRRYSTPATQVMVYLAPSPDCVNSSPLLQRSFASLGASPPVLLPASDFAADPYYAHIRPDFVPTATALLAKVVSERLQLEPLGESPNRQRIAAPVR